MTLTTGSNVDALRNFFDLLYDGRPDEAIDRYGHPDFEFVVSSADNPALTRQIPWAGFTHKGRQGFLNLTGMLFGEFEPLAFERRRFTQAGDRVFVEGHFSFRHRTTGKMADSDWLARFEMRDGKIASGQFYENTAAVADART